MSVFLTQNHHLDLGIVLLPAGSATGSFPGHNSSSVTEGGEGGGLVPHVRFRGIICPCSGPGGCPSTREMGGGYSDAGDQGD